MTKGEVGHGKEILMRSLTLSSELDGLRVFRLRWFLPCPVRESKDCERAAGTKLLSTNRIPWRELFIVHWHAFLALWYNLTAEEKLTKEASIMIILPKREGRCPAAAYCGHLGNLRPECIESSGSFHDSNTEKCLASIVMLLSWNHRIFSADVPQKVIDGFSQGETQ